MQIEAAVECLLAALKLMHKFNKAANNALPAKAVDKLVGQCGRYGQLAVDLLCARRKLPEGTAESSVRGHLTAVYESCRSWEKGEDGKYHQSRQVILPDISVVKCAYDTISEGGSDGITVEFAVLAVKLYAALESEAPVHQALAMLFALDYVYFSEDCVCITA